MKVVQERRNELTGTTIRVNDFRGDPELSSPDHPWFTVCEEHQEGAEWRTRAEALKMAASTPDWCGGCEDEWNARKTAEEEEAEIAHERSRVGIGAPVHVALVLACGCRFSGGDPVPAIEAVNPGVSQVCPRHRTSQVVVRTSLRLAERPVDARRVPA